MRFSSIAYMALVFHQPKISKTAKVFHFLYLFCLSSLTTGVHMLPVHSLNSVILFLCVIVVPHTVIFVHDCWCVNKTARSEEVLCLFRRDNASMSTSRNDCSRPSSLMTSLQACCEGNNIFLTTRTSSKINPFKITLGSFVWWKQGAVTKFLPWFDSETLNFPGSIQSSSLSTLYLHFQTPSENHIDLYIS